MGLTVTQSEDGTEFVIKIEGRFDFHVHAEFRDSYCNLPSTTKFVIDLEETSFMDSSAMGMLLLLREFVGGTDDMIRLINTPADIKKSLSISNLDKLLCVE